MTGSILHLIPSIAPRHGGPTTTVLGMVGALRRSGIDARIVTTDDDVGARLPVECGRWVEHEGLPVWFVPRVTTRQHTLIGFTYTPGIRAWLDEHLGGFDFLHIHTVFSHPATVAALTARRRGVPYAIRPLGQLCEWSLGVRSPFKRLHLALVGRRNLNHANFLHATSHMEAEESMRTGCTCPVKVIPLGIDLPPLQSGSRDSLRDELGLPTSCRLAVFLSRLHEKKNVELLLQALAKISHQDIHLVIAGDGEPGYVDSLHEVATRLGVSARVHWLGHVTGERKWRALAGGDVFVLPSSSENFGNVVIEALACGLPAILSPSVALADEVTSANLGRTIPLDADAWAAAISEAALRTSDDLDMHNRARSFVAQNYSWDQIARLLREACLPSMITSQPVTS